MKELYFGVYECEEKKVKKDEEEHQQIIPLHRSTTIGRLDQLLDCKQCN